MAWPVEAVLILTAFGGCWLAAGAGLVAWRSRSWSMAAVGALILASLGGEVAALNGSAAGGTTGGIGVASLLCAGLALAALAAYLVQPPPEPRIEEAHRLSGPALNPDSEA